MKTHITYCQITVIILALFLLAFSPVYSQTRKELEQKHKKTQEEIKYTNDLLKKTQRDKKISMNQLMVLNKKISARQNLINTITEEIKLIDIKINENLKVIQKLESELKSLTESYARMIVFAYKTRDSYDKLVFVLSSADFNIAYRRIKYLQHYATYRKKQMEKIKNKRHDISQKVAELKIKKEEKELLLNEEKNETQLLSGEKNEQSKIVSHLKEKEKELSRKLAEQKLADQKLKNAINEIIAEEIRKAELARKEKLKKEKENKVAKKTEKTSVFELTPAEQLVSDKFESNKGKLPWPLERGVITGTFGEHDHPVLKGIKLKNDGVYISTTQGSAARSIFDGTVSKIIAIPGKNKVVIIKHGEFFSVYSNLSDVCVSVGEKVKPKQKIGTVFIDSGDDNKTVLELQLWQGTSKLNPELWLSGIN